MGIFLETSALRRTDVKSAIEDALETDPERLKGAWEMRLAGLVLSVVVGVASSAAGAMAAPAAVSYVDPGCVANWPTRVEARGPAGPLARICASIDSGSWGVQMTNISSTVLRVQLPARALAPKVSTPFATRLGSIAALGAVGSGCDSDNQCTLPAGGTLFTVILTPVAFTFSVDPHATIAQNAARAVGSWVEAKLSSPGRRFANRVAACGQAAVALAQKHPVWSDALRAALNARTCTTLIEDVGRESEPVKRPAAASRVIGIAKTLAGGDWIDELTIGIAKLLEHR
ncbi:MAG: hypothetical protein ACXVRS_07015 [Gaiellaceae bacterium]